VQSKEDLIHPFVRNKFRKLKYNLLQAKIRKRYSFLEALSNHIAAVALQERKGFKTIRIIQGMN
jgi:1-aminocyclopropane-1-carboxylate deaminase